MPKVLNKRKDFIPEGSVYVGRPSKYGNPFSIGVDGTRGEVLDKYRKYLNDNPDLVADIKKELKGKDLVCWCMPLRCHAEILLEIANEEKI
jgi:hypothetical protein